MFQAKVGDVKDALGEVEENICLIPWYYHGLKATGAAVIDEI